MEEKKAIYVKIFFEYVQACEHLVVLIDAVKKSPSISGITKRIVKCPAGSDAFRYLWKDLRRFKKSPYKSGLRSVRSATFPIRRR